MSKFRISWMYRYHFYDLKVHFWWHNKCFIWGRSSWKTLYTTVELLKKLGAFVIGWPHRTSYAMCCRAGCKIPKPRNSYDAFSKKMVAYALFSVVSEGELTIHPPALGALRFFLYSIQKWPKANKAKHHLWWLLRYYIQCSFLSHSSLQPVSWFIEEISFRYLNESDK